MAKRKTAAWFRRGPLWVVRPNGWPKNCELTFTTRDMMVAWAHNAGQILKAVE